jgi:membrane fusion protein, heavy metal efflux system
MKNSITKIFLFLTSLFLLACKNDKKTEVAKASTETVAKEETKSEEVILTAEQYKAVDIQTGTIEMRNLNAVVKANGYTNVPPQNTANVSTLIGGSVLQINVVEGAYIAKGKVLATIQNMDVVQMQEDYAVASANIEYLQLEYERQRILSEENVNAKKQFQEVKAKLAVEQARAKAAKSRLEMLHLGTDSSPIIPIYAPISGYIGKIQTTKGSYAEVGKPLFEIIDINEMHLDLNVYEKDLFKIKEGQTADVILINHANKNIKAKIFAIGKTFNNESKTVTVHAHINADDLKGLIAGMFVTANINVNDATVQTLPKDAIVKNGEKYYVFMDNGEDKTKNRIFKPIEVVPGVTDLGYTEVRFTQEASSSQYFVKKGAFYLLSAMMNGGEY